MAETGKIHGAAFLDASTISPDWLAAIPKKADYLKIAKKIGIKNCEAMSYDELEDAIIKYEKGGTVMLNLEKIYAHRSGANRDIRKAVENGECEAGTYKAKAVEGGFQIQAQAVETATFAEVEIPAAPVESSYTAEPIPTKTEPQPKSTATMSDTQAAILDALIAADAIDGTWLVLAIVEVPKKSLPGATRGLLSKGYIRTEWGKDDSGKRAAIATVTEAGYAALKAS